MDRRWNRPGIVAALATSFTACAALAYVWFGYDPSRASAWLITPATVTLASPGQAVQLHVVEYIPEIRETNKDITASCSFWTDNPEWTLTSNGLLACHVSGPGVVHALLPSGTNLSNTIVVDPDLPLRILQTPVVPKATSPSHSLDYYNIGWYIDQRNIGIAAKALLAVSLQGLVNRSQPRIYVNDQLCTVNSNTIDYWKPVLEDQGYNFANWADLYSLVAKYQHDPNISGVALYDPELLHDGQFGDIINCMTTLCGLENLIAATPAQYIALTGTYGVTLPARYTFDYQYLHANNLTNSFTIYRAMVSNFWPRCSRRVLAQIHPHLHLYDRDYLIANRIFCCFWRNDASVAELALLDTVESNLYGHGVIMVDWAAHDIWCERYYGKVDQVFANRESPVLLAQYDVARNYTNTLLYKPVLDLRRSRSPEYVLIATNSLPADTFAATTWINLTNGPAILYHPSHNESTYVGQLASRCHTITYSCGMANLSLHSGFRIEDLTITPWQPPVQQFDRNKIYTTFILSDGDNLVWDKQLWPLMLDPSNWRAHAFGAGYGINPLLCEVAPVMVKWLIEHSPPNVEPMWNCGGVNSTETETYGTAFGPRADQLLREYFQLSLPYWNRTGIRTVNPQFWTLYRGIAVAATVFTNALLVTPGIIGSFNVLGGERGTNWMAGQVPVICPMEGYDNAGINADASINDQLRFVLEKDRRGDYNIYRYDVRPQFWVINVLGNYSMPWEGDVDLYYKDIGTDKLFSFPWLNGKGLISNGQTNIATVAPSVLGELYKTSGGK